MARNNFYSQSDVTRPPESFNNDESIIEGKTEPEDNDPRRNLETQPDFAVTNTRTTPRFTRQYEPTIIDDEILTPSVKAPEKKKRNRRVVGWIVGIGGPCRGIDYRIHEGKNYIGREALCEVNVEDPKVSAGNVAQVVFDPRSKRFFSSDCDGTSTICYLNGEPLLGKHELKIYDRLEMGDSRLLFVPLCGDAFTWDEEEKEAD